MTSTNDKIPQPQSFRFIFKDDLEVQFPLTLNESLTPSSPVVVNITVEHSSLTFRWTLQGSADKYHIWIEPAEGPCSISNGSVCELGVKESTLNITGLTPGEGKFTPLLRTHTRVEVLSIK